MVPLLLGISLLAYGIIRLAPGDPTLLLVDREAATAEVYAALRLELGLDEPLPVQYAKTMTSLFAGELRSFRTKQRVVDMMGDRLPPTLLLGVVSILIGFLVGIALGVVLALRPYGRVDNVGSLVSILGFAMPNFWLALMLMMFFSVRLNLLPASGIRPLSSSGWNPLEMLPYVVMPALVLGTGLLASVSRYVRSAMLDALNQDYVRTARAKGLRERVVVVRHALRNSLIPVITLVGFFLPFLIGGAAVVETIFAIPGVGSLAVGAVFSRDYPVILTITMFSAVAVVFGNLLSDILYAVADPRIRYS
jgi:peptide/nickel transport system permease protein